MIIFFAKCVGSNHQTLRSRQFRSHHYLLVVWANHRIGWAMWFSYCPRANLSVLRPICNGKDKITTRNSQRLCTIVDLETRYKEVKKWNLFMAYVYRKGEGDDPPPQPPPLTAPRDKLLLLSSRLIECDAIWRHNFHAYGFVYWLFFGSVIACSVFHALDDLV